MGKEERTLDLTSQFSKGEINCKGVANCRGAGRQSPCCGLIMREGSR